MPATTPPVPHRLATAVWTLVVPLAVLAGGLALAWSWRDELPDPVATHWSDDGVDGFGSASSTLWVLVAIVVPFSLFMWLVGRFAGRTAAVRRLAAFFGVWFAVTMTVVLVGSLAVQRGLTDAHDVGGLGAVLGIGFGAATVLGAIAAVAVPRDAPLPTTAPIPADLPRAHLAGTAGASWTGQVSFAHPGVAAAIAIALLVALGWLTRSWETVVPTALALGLAGLLLRWTVTVDRHGLTARAVLPWPRTVIPLDEVVSAEVVTVEPWGEFGGWGYRVGPGGRAGIVLRRGEALLVRRTGGRELVVTVDGASRGAALLNTLAERSR